MSLSTNQLSSIFSNNVVDINLHSFTLSIIDVLNEIDNINNTTSPGLGILSNCFFIEYKFVLAVPLYIYLIYLYLQVLSF